MTKKRFSLLIDDNTPTKQEQGMFTSKPTNNKEERPHFSLFDDKTESKQEKIPFSRKLHYWLIQNKTRFLHRTYGIHINYNNQKSIQYLLEVKCIGYKKGIFTYALHRKRFFKNGKQLEGIFEEIAEQCANCLYPLHIHVNEQGQLITVANQETIEERWKTLKTELSKRYTGKPFINYCKKIDKSVSTSESILKSLHTDVVYDILFSKLYFNYSNAFTQPLQKEFKWFPGVQKVKFKGNQTVTPVLKENNRMLINYKGTMFPMSQSNQGETTIQYQLDSKNHTILRVDGVFTYTSNQQNKTIAFKAIWQEGLDKTEARKIEDQKRRGAYMDPDAKWWEFWK